MTTTAAPPPALRTPRRKRRARIDDRGWLFVAPFAIVFALTCVLMLAPASRFAERYAFSANYAIATAGAIVAARAWPSLARGVARLDRAIPAFPAIVWLVLMLARLAFGPFLPRISG